MGNVVSLSRKRKRLGREQADALRQLAFDFDLDEVAQAEIDNAIYKITEEPGERWLFMKLSQEQFRHVTKAIRDCRNVATTFAVWNAALTYMRWDTGEVVASRNQIAEDAGVALQSVSTAISDLVRIGAVLRRRHGRKVTYVVNPRVGWSGSEGTRQTAAREAPMLRLVSSREEQDQPS